MKILLRNLVWLVLLAPPAAALDVSSDGSDGAFSPVANTVVDLSLAPTATWTTPGTGAGVYDPDKWAVVFKYSSVNIPSGVTVTFKNHPSGAPVVWLVNGSVTIAGTVSLDGEAQAGGQYRPSTPGPGGFAGGRALFSNAYQGSAGFGPGGGHYGSGGNGGSHSLDADGLGFGRAYGNSQALPLRGGSGGGANTIGGLIGGGGGGGAILVAAATNVQLNGAVRTNGGSGDAGSFDGGAGAGGAIRLIAPRVAGSGTLRAISGGGFVAASAGFIRVEADTLTLTDLGQPPYTYGLPGATPQLWPDASAPRLRAVSYGGAPIAADPRPHFTLPADVTVTATGPLPLVIEADNIPIASAVFVRVTPQFGQAIEVSASFTSGDATSSVWTASLQLPRGFASLTVMARTQ